MLMIAKFSDRGKTSKLKALRTAVRQIIIFGWNFEKTSGAIKLPMAFPA
jgi:hypothetical protein